MLEQLFGSRTRVKLLRMFLNNPQQPYYLRQLSREVGSQLNSVRREVANLMDLGIITQHFAADPKNAPRGESVKKYYAANTAYLLYAELRALLMKAQLMVEKSLIGKIKNIAKVHYLALLGTFVGIDGGATDLLIVGTVNRQKLASLIREFERELNRSINYTVMSLSEYKYRHDITDRFLYEILEGKKIVVLDRLKHAREEI